MWLLRKRRRGPAKGTTFGDLLLDAPITFGEEGPPSGGTAPRRLSLPQKPITRDRLELLRTHVNKGDKILEIGPSFNPIAPKRDGYTSYSVDKYDAKQLKARFAGRPGVDASKIEEVDFLWTSLDLLDVIPSSHHHSFDVVLISHVLEHIPDPIRFLRSLQNLLKIGGYVTLAVPDKRYCFDLLRPITTTGAWIEAFNRADLVHSQRTLFEHNTNAVARHGNIAWREGVTRIEDLTFNGQSLSNAYTNFFSSGLAAPNEYIDCHAWIFTPSSFTLLINECQALELISLIPDFVSYCIGSEFIAHLRYAQRRPISHHERLQLSLMVAKEQQRGFRDLQTARPNSIKDLLRNMKPQ
jgi:predicted SAM-dependent methyltransferase